MHSHPIDCIEAYEPWSYTRACKTIAPDSCVESPATGVGHASESQIMDAVFWVGRLLVLSSSDFQKNGNVTGIHDFSYGILPQPGDTIQVKVSVVSHDWDDIILEADVSSSNNFVARGSFTLEEVELIDEDEICRLRSLWHTLYKSTP